VDWQDGAAGAGAEGIRDDDAAHRYRAQVFTTATAGPLAKASVKLGKQGNPAGAVEATVRAVLVDGPNTWGGLFCADGKTACARDCRHARWKKSASTGAATCTARAMSVVR
jgi:hypothetical protein